MLIIHQLVEEFICSSEEKKKKGGEQRDEDETNEKAHQRYVTVVPSVIIHQCGPVGHAGYLVAVVPPRHDARMLVCVLSQPVVGLPEVIQDVTRPDEEKNKERG